MKKPNGTNSVYKTSDGMWIGQIVIGKYPNGRLRYKRFKSKKQSDVVEKMRNYENGFAQISCNENAYLGDYLLGYLNNVKKIVLKSTSFDRNMNTYSLINRYIGQYTIGELTSQFIQTQLINKLIDNKYSYSSIHKAYVLLNECMNYAVENKKIAENPCKTVKQPTKANLQTKKVRFLNEEEIERFIEFATAMKPNGKPYYIYGLIICLDIYTGLRCGELSALRWKDIDFNNQYIIVNKTISTTYEYDEFGKKRKRNVKCEDTVKTENGDRIVKMNTKSIKILQELKERCSEDYNPENFIVSNSLECRSVDVLSDSYSNIAKAAGIENALGIHTLRHTFASLLIKKGVDIKIVSDLLGHKDVAFTYNTYVHLIEEQKAKAIELLDLD